MDTPTVASSYQDDNQSLSDEEIFDENLKSNVESVKDVHKTPDGRARHVDTISQSTLSYGDMVDDGVSVNSAVQDEISFTENYFSSGPKQYSEIVDRKLKL